METALSDFPKTIQEVMQNVCVYVEVRSATENRTDGIKKTIASMGAKVNDRISKYGLLRFHIRIFFFSVISKFAFFLLCFKFF